MYHTNSVNVNDNLFYPHRKKVELNTRDKKMKKPQTKRQTGNNISDTN